MLRFTAFFCAMTLATALYGADSVDLTGRPWKLVKNKDSSICSASLQVIGSPELPGWSLTCDYSDGGKSTGMELSLDPPLNISALSLKIKSPAMVLGVQTTDAAGQSFLRLFKISGNTDLIHELEIDSFCLPKGSTWFWCWGKINDGVFRPPLRKISLFTYQSTGPVGKKQWTDCFYEIKGLSSSVTPATTSENIKKATPLAQAVISPAEATVIDPAELIALPGAKSLIHFKCTTTVSNQALDYCVRDYDGKEIYSGKTPVNDGLFSIPAPESNGFYELHLPSVKLICGVIVMPLFKDKPDNFFGMDCEFSVMKTMESSSRCESYLKLLAHAGIGSVRDRALWSVLEKKPGIFDWNARNADTIHQLYAKYGCKILDANQDAPAWTGSIPQRNHPGFFPFPRDLIAASSSLKEIGSRYAALRNGFEVWNEPEHSFGASMPGDQLASFQRVITYVFENNGIKTPLVAGVMTGNNMSPNMFKGYLANGMITNADAFSFHDYHHAENMVSQIAGFRTLLADDPNGKLPFWITESGWPWTYGTSRATMPKDIESAREITMKAVEAKAAGVAKYYPFLFTYHQEPPFVYAMMDKNHTPQRQLSAYFTLVRILANYEYVGDLASPTGAVLNRVFVKGSQAVIVAYTGAKDTTITVPPGIRLDRAETIDGRRLVTAPKYSVPNGILYLFTERSAIEDKLVRSTSAMAQLNIARSHRAMPKVVHPVVLQFDFERGSLTWTLDGYMFRNPTRAIIPIKFNNLSQERIKVSPVLQLPSGARLLEPVPSEIELPPRSVSTLNVIADLTDALRAVSLTSLTIRDQYDHAAPLVLALRNGSFEKAIGYTAGNVVLPESWRDLDSSWIKLEGKSCWKKWEGTDSPAIRAAFKVFYNQTTLHFVILVADEHFFQPFPAIEAWRADSVQIAFQALLPNGERKIPFTEICAAMLPTGPAIFRHRAEQGATVPEGLLQRSKLTFVRLPGGYRYDIAIDAEEAGLGILSPGRRLALSMIINDNAGQGRAGYLYWGDGIADCKNPNQFNELILNR